MLLDLTVIQSHLLTASGILSIIKAAMMIERSTILPNALFEQLNPNIDDQKVKVRILLVRTHKRSWQR